MMKKYTLPDPAAVGYLCVRESIRGFMIYVCNDETNFVAPLVFESFQKFNLRKPHILKKYFQSRESAEIVLSELAKLNNLIIINE